MSEQPLAIEVFLKHANDLDQHITRLYDIVSRYATLPAESINWDHVDALDALSDGVKELVNEHTIGS